MKLLSREEDFALLCSDALFGTWLWTMAGLLIDIVGFGFIAVAALEVVRRNRQLWVLTRKAEMLRVVAKEKDRNLRSFMAHSEAQAFRKRASDVDREWDRLTREGLDKEHGRLIAGVLLVFTGFALQIIGSWPCP